MNTLPFRWVDSPISTYDFNRCLDFLNEGSFSTVYSARVISTGEEVALKVIPKDKLHIPGRTEMIISEVEISKRIHHPNCIRFIDAVQTDNAVFIVLERVTGKDLCEVLQDVRSHGMSEDVATSIFIEILAAVAHLHEDHGVVHRDIKPENVMLQMECPTSSTGGFSVGSVKLLDFGLAKYLGLHGHGRPRPKVGVSFRTQPPPHRTGLGKGASCGLSSSASSDSIDTASSVRSSSPCGTIHYTPLEELQSTDKHYTTRGRLLKRDMFSLGVIFHQLLCGRLPFPGKKRHELIYAMATAGTLELSGEAWQNVSDDAKALVRELLQLDPTQRPTILQAQRYCREKLQNRCVASSGRLPSIEPPLWPQLEHEAASANDAATVQSPMSSSDCKMASREAEKSMYMH